MNTGEQTFESLHLAWAVSYTHIDGNTYQSTLCGAKGLTQEFIKSREGIAKIDCIAEMHMHDESCQDRGAVEGEESFVWGKTRKLVQFDRSAA